MVPNGWVKQPIGKICKSIVPGRNKPKVFNGDIPWVTTPEIDGKYIPSSKQVNYISNNVAKECGAKIVPEGAVVIAAVGDLGLTAIASEKLVLNQQLHAFVCPESVSNEYIAYFLSSQKTYMYTVASKTTIPYMNKSNCESIPILLPPLPEQQKIAKILSTWDKVITTTDKLIATSQQQKKALMQQLLTGKKRLVNPETGRVFEGNWEEHPLQYVLDKIIDYRGQSVPKAQSGIPLITARNVRMGYLDFSSQEYIDANQFSSWMTRGTPQVGDILFTTEAPLGMACRYPTVGIFGVGQRTVTLRVNSKLNSDFLLYYLLSAKGQLLIDLRSSGSTAKGIKSSELKKVKIYYPKDCQEQQKIASVLTVADKEIELLQAKLAHLKDEKMALMQQLLTGKRRVKVEDQMEIVS
ncbi:restriction endonuclease subunit S [Shewanella xiamenensis]|uniref:restriction endonuclease subunit S n=1 Tax=Shewanella xiamenensis TaxID=332186 RepID=UPI0004DAB476|nr:restriction endonuclease subunit S [Shewanella xiamenensis]KEK29609.1 type I site-specific deoxyribonuclease [Shewanella xiamenensis]